MVKIVVPKPEEVKDYVVLAYLTRLYMPKRCLKSDYWRCIERHPRRRRRWMFRGQYYSRPYDLLSMALDENQNPVGIALLSGHGLATYVRKEYRRQGVGTQLVQALVKTLPNEVLINVSMDDAPEFYQRVLPQQYGKHAFFRRLPTSAVM